ncbi:MAG: SDR family oxidoreductase [Deltaproteobacteria bacterium]|jgi:NAD(P)-dependent dehydrogenase (short-subunit alcohol dehydrogenase family)|nr:SDR family oxidoreductase [Deltaproteobacteria bacterium]
METTLKDKIALVTGAGAGIGLAIARRFAEMGASVVVGDINEKAALAAVPQLPTPVKQEHEAAAMDVTDRKSVAAVMKRLGDRFGRLDILMNNAGVSTMNRLEDLTEEEWDFNFNVNVKGVFLVTQAALPLMKERGGRIINAASMAAVKAAPLLAHYTASKFAVHGFTKSAAIELAPFGITVNCVCPGYVKTSMQDREVVWEGRLRNMSPAAVSAEYVEHTPLGRLCLPEDVADVVGFLASPQAGFMTGEALNIAGGANIV